MLKTRETEHQFVLKRRLSFFEAILAALAFAISLSALVNLLTSAPLVDLFGGTLQLNSFDNYLSLIIAVFGVLILVESTALLPAFLTRETVTFDRITARVTARVSGPYSRIFPRDERTISFDEFEFVYCWREKKPGRNSYADHRSYHACMALLIEEMSPMVVSPKSKPFSRWHDKHMFDIENPPPGKALRPTCLATNQIKPICALPRA